MLHLPAFPKILMIYQKVPNKEQKVEECDATEVPNLFYRLAHTFPNS